MIIILGTVMRLIKEMTVMRGNVRRVVVMKDKKMISQKIEKRANVNVNDEESGKDGGTEVANQM